MGIGGSRVCDGCPVSWKCCAARFVRRCAVKHLEKECEVATTTTTKKKEENKNSKQKTVLKHYNKHYNYCKSTSSL